MITNTYEKESNSGPAYESRTGNRSKPFQHNNGTCGQRDVKMPFPNS